VARRNREIGIRLAIGASVGHVSKIVLGEFVRLLAAGIAIGLAVALFVTRPLAIFFVPGLKASDPPSFAVVIAVLAGTGVLAAIGPLRRALRVDPLRCLRYE
jgi:ABC-type antimicrobial peptide transport system permease subunit